MQNQARDAGDQLGSNEPSNLTSQNMIERTVDPTTRRPNDSTTQRLNDPTTQRPDDPTTQRPGTTFVSVRFGNVLGSRGSVIPLFLEQLKNGGPLTVTHKDMVRFFMTIPEAVSLILQASTMGEGGEVFVLDMGEPVRIVELAEELITIQGLRPYKDIDIEFTGIRPGEKIFEEILTAEEGTVASKHEKVFVARNGVKYSLSQVEEILKEFKALAANPSISREQGVKDLLKKYVRHYEEE
jgi:FlaA1/EpsC-like NDP-sugar epimerase